MSELSGVLIIKLNKEIKPVAAQIAQYLNNADIEQLLQGFGVTSLTKLMRPELTGQQTLEFADNELKITDKQIKRGYLVLTVHGLKWLDFTQVLMMLPNCQFWANFKDDNEIEYFSAKTKKSSVECEVVWDGESDPQQAFTDAQARWYALMNKTIISFIESPSQAEDILKAALAHVETMPKADHWAAFYRQYPSRDSLMLKLTINDIENRLSLLDIHQQFINNEKMTT